MPGPRYPFSFQQKTISIYALFAGILFIFLKWIDSGFIRSVIDFFFTFYPFLLILTVFFVSFLKYRSYQKAAFDLPHVEGVLEKMRLETLQTIAALLVISFFFYLLYSPESYLSVFLLLSSFFSRLITWESVFLLLAWGMIILLSGTSVYAIFWYLKVKDTPAYPVFATFKKRLLQASFFSVLSLFTLSLVAFGEAYRPATEYLASTFAPLLGKESTSDLSFSSAMSKSLSLLGKNVSSANGNLLGEIKGTRSELDTAIAASGLKITGELSDELKTRLATTGGTIKGSLVVQDSFDVLGDTFLQDTLPQTTNKYNLGSESKRWNTLYATTGNFSQAVITGDLTVSGTVFGTFSSPSLSAGSVVFIDATKTLSEDSAFSYEKLTKQLSLQNLLATAINTSTFTLPTFAQGSLVFIGASKALSEDATLAYDQAIHRLSVANLATGTLNGNTITTSTGTLTLAPNKTLTASNTLTFSGIDNSILNIGTGGTLGTAAYVLEANYALLAGRSGGQTLIGGSDVTDVLKLQGTSGNGTLTSPAVQVKVGNNGGTTAMTVLNNGNVGIGTTSPNRLLTIKKNGGVIGLGSNNYENIVFGATGSAAPFADEAYFQMNNAGTAQIVLRAAGNNYINGGNVGIGTTSPSARLTVQGAGTTTGETLKLQNSAGTATLASLDNGVTTLRGSTVTDAPTLGSEFLTGGAWTSTDWTGDNTTGWVHANGPTTALSYSLAAVSGTKYQIAYTVTRSAGSVTIAFGGQSIAGVTATGAFGPTATSTGNLVVTPTTDFVGSIVLSIKAITAVSTPLFALQDSGGTAQIEMRAGLTGTGNTFIGNGAGRYNTTGNNNSAQGYQALYSNTTGNYNSAQGSYALYSNTTGYNNSAQGSYALFSNTTGSYNSAQGYQALYNNTTGSYNSAQGMYALYSNTTGSYNSAQGMYALGSNTTGSYNSAQGYQALYNNTTGSNNSAQGMYALGSNTTGSNNSAQGMYAGRYLADGSTGRTTGNNGLYLGYDTKASANGTDNEIVIGASAIGLGSNTVVLGNTSIVTTVLRGNVGIGNAIPTQALDVAGSIALPMTTSSTTGVIYKDTYRFLHNYKASGTNGENFFAGISAGNFTMSGSGAQASYNTGVGTLSLTALTSGTENTAVGYNTLAANTSGSYNNAFGKNALASNQGSWHNTAVGMNSLTSTTTGGANSVLGNNALQYNMTGSENIALGFAAGKGASTSSNVSYNVLLGYNAGLAIQTNANSNIMIGHAAGDNVSTGATNILIGADIDAQSATGSSQLSIGNLIFGTGGFGTVTTVGAGNIGIGTATPAQKLSVAGTFGILEGGSTPSFYTIFQGGDQTANLTYTLPTVLATAGQQLTDVTGNGVLSWSAAGSLRTMKTIDTHITDPTTALNELLATNIYAFHYKQGMGTGDTDTQYVGVMADEASWAMHYDGRVINPVNTLGYMVLGIQATNAKIDTLNLKTDQNVTTLGALQSSVDTQLSVIGDSLVSLDTRMTEIDVQKTGRLTTLDTRVLSIESSLTDLLTTQTTHESRLTTLESEMSTLKAEHLALMDFYSTFELGDAVMKDKDNNVDLLGGRLTAKIVETGGLVITVSDPDAATIGTAILYPIAKDEDDDGKDDYTGLPMSDSDVKDRDGKSVTIKTKAVTESSRIFVTISSKLISQTTIMVTDTYPGKKFTVELVSPAEEAVHFNWWIVQEGE
jgi:hypothetical protein